MAKGISMLLPDLKMDLQQILRVYNQERLLTPGPDLKIYSSWEQNWYHRPAAVIRKNGVIVNGGFSIDYDFGAVTFNTPNDATDYVVAEFFFAPYSDSQLQTYLERATSRLGTLVSAALDPTAVEDPYQQCIVDMAWDQAFHAIMAETANYHKWIMDGVEIHKDGVTKNYGMVIQTKRDNINEQIARLRMLTMSGSAIATETVTN